jgi:hypothetical protein
MLFAGASPVIGPSECSRVRTRGLLACLSKNRRFFKENPLYSVLVIGSHRGLVWSHHQSPTHDWEDQQIPELLVLFPSFKAFPRSTGVRLRAAR